MESSAYLVAGSHFAETMSTFSTLSVGPAAVAPGAALAAPVAYADLLWTVPVMRT